MKSRYLMSMFMVVAVVWNLIGFAINFFEDAWGIKAVTVFSVVINSLIIIFLPLSQSNKKWTLLASTVLGLVLAGWSGIGVVFAPTDFVWGPAVSMILGLLIAIFGFYAYKNLRTSLGKIRFD